MIVLFLLAASFPNKIPLPDLRHAGDVVITDSALYVVDPPEGKLYHLGPDGKVLNTYAKVGQGPGEWLYPTRLKVNQGKLYVCDPKKNYVFVFDLNLKLLEEVSVGGKCNDIAIVGQDWFVVCFDSGTEKLIRKFSGKEHTKSITFADALKPIDKLRGMQNGMIAAYKNEIFFVRSFNATVEVYDTNGVLKRKFSPAGFEPDLLKDININKLNFHNDIRYTVFFLDLRGEYLDLRLGDNVNESTFVFQYNFANKTWSKPETRKRLIYTPNGEAFVKIESEEEGFYLTKTKE